jgi:hypothetical protein
MEKIISESRIQREIRLKTNETYGLLLRNNSGVAREITTKGGVRDVRYGLGNTSAKLNKIIKSSDLIGITPLVIQEKHVGRVWGVFTAIETKNSKWKGPANEKEFAQLHFLDVIQHRGGIATFATKPEDYNFIISKFYYYGGLS